MIIDVKTASNVEIRIRSTIIASVNKQGSKVNVSYFYYPAKDLTKLTGKIARLLIDSSDKQLSEFSTLAKKDVQVMYAWDVVK